MQKSDFSQATPGRLVDTPDGLCAFVPNRLPPLLTVDNELWRADSDAGRALARLEVVLPSAQLDPFLVLYALIEREAYCTSRMEGTYTTPVQLALFELDEGKDTQDDGQKRMTKEVVNYRRAVLECVETLKGASPGITHALIRGAHRMLLSGVRGENKHPGEYRTTQNYIGKNIASSASARFVPPPPDEMRIGMEDLLQFMGTCMQSTSAFPPLTALALTHYQFEALHPFEDGNGRIGRLIVPLMLISNGYMKEPLLHISATVEKHREQYSDLLLAVSQRGAWREWVLFFLRVLQEAANETMVLVGKLNEIREEYRKKLAAPKRSIALFRFVDSLFQSPGTTIAKAGEIMGVGFAQASEHIKTLVSVGILTETTGKAKNRRYIAPRILDVVFGAV